MASPTSSNDVALPKSIINDIIKETMPSIRVGHDARQLVFTCCSEFLKHFSSVVSEIREKSENNIISSGHVFSALESLGLESYIPEVENVLQNCKTEAQRKTNTRLESSGIPEDELLRQQQDLIAEARQQQALLTHQEWRDAQLPQQTQVSASTVGQQGGSSTHEDEGINM